MGSDGGWFQADASAACCGMMPGMCLRCGRERPIRMRGLCKSCATVVCRQGRLGEYPAVRRQRPLVEAVEDYLIVRGRASTAEEKAAAEALTI